MAVLSDRDIQREMGDKIVIQPFDKKNLGNCSYDVTIGPHYYRAYRKENDLYDPYNEDNVRSTWTLYHAESLQETINCYSYRCPAIEELNPPRGAKLIILHPRETILAHTNEFIGGRGNITTMMKARSSIGRNFIEVCKCAGWGDVGYINRWTMEITNNSDYYIPLIVGSRIAQIVFMYTGEVKHPYQSKYQSSTDLETIKNDWSPTDMLPKIYIDHEFNH